MDMAALQRIPDTSALGWRPSPEDPKLYMRNAIGGEMLQDAYHRHNHRELLLFVGVDVTLDTNVPPETLLKHAYAAWEATRFETPQVAVQTLLDKEGTVFITYRPVTSASEAASWSHRTVQLASGHKNLDELRNALTSKILPDDNGDQMFVYILPGTDAKSYGFLIHSSHVPFDGSGVKIATNKFLAQLGAQISGKATGNVAWGTETKNLLPATIDLLGPDEISEGEPYFNTLMGVMGDMGASMPRSHGFKTRNVGPGPSRRFKHTFSTEDTTKIIKGAKKHGYSVNHLLHAGVAIVTAIDNPPTSETPADAVIVNYGLMNMRGRVREPYSLPGGYPGYCLSTSAIQFPIANFPEHTPASEEGLYELLTKVASVAKTEYIKQAAYPSLLAIHMQQCLMMKAAIAAGPPPPPWMGPWYSGDGVETYIEPAHPGLRVNDVFLSLNKTEPGPFFRTWSFQGRLTLSIDANIHAMPEGVCQGFLNKWVEIIAGFAKLN